MYFFIGGLFPDKNYYCQVIKNSNGIIQNAANVLQQALVRGFDDCDQPINILSLPFVGTFYRNYKCLFVKRMRFSHEKSSVMRDVVLNFNTLPVLGLFSKYKALSFELNKVCHTNDILIIYSIHTPFLLSAVRLKRKKKVHICLIVPDLPQYMSETHNPLFLLLKKIDSFIIRAAIRFVDSFVLLSDYMAESLKIGERPWIRIEGIYLPQSEYIQTKKEDDFVFAYTGTLDFRYGILDLLDAFMKIKRNDIRLWICGRGNSEVQVRKAISIDCRITYWGQLPHEKVLKLQQRATVLVNPRTAEGAYTKYSFPSKTIEYMASGTPCIMYPLPALPIEYQNYLFIVKENGLENSMREVLSLSKTELYKKGIKAKEFLEKYKNPQYQVQKIIQMIESNV